MLEKDKTIAFDKSNINIRFWCHWIRLNPSIRIDFGELVTLGFSSIDYFVILSLI